ncbi:MAG: Fic family protein [Ignavibacteriae bacterium]|nr:Fic family protein [Ignavibacteriota bacterium]
MTKFIYQDKDWPNFIWNSDSLVSLLGEVRNKQGLLIGKMDSMGFDLKAEATLENLTLDTIKSSEIEGEFLNAKEVRSSIARHLGLDISGLIPSDRYVDGLVEMMLDATQNYNKPLNAERLYGWQAALFPAGRSGLYKLKTGKWRDDKKGPMQVVSGAFGKEIVHFQAPDASGISNEMKDFLKWFNNEKKLDPVFKAGIAHLWFITIHPFEDGNGRIARAITDMQLARADGSKQRFYSMSAQIRAERSKYYNILEETQKGSLDITQWLKWFLKCLVNALNQSDNTLRKVIFKAEFWNKHADANLHERQKLLLNKMLGGFEGKLTSTKWAKIAKCSNDTALRDIQDLINKQILIKENAGGRSTNYLLRK